MAKSKSVAKNVKRGPYDGRVEYERDLCLALEKVSDDMPDYEFTNHAEGIWVFCKEQLRRVQEHAKTVEPGDTAEFVRVRAHVVAWEHTVRTMLGLADFWRSFGQNIEFYGVDGPEELGADDGE